MKKNLNKYIQPFLTFLLIMVFSLFCFSILKNIHYPLLWNDEADTAMLAERVTQFGYPKVHDGKNILYQAQSLNRKVITEDSLDAHIEVDWLSYFFASPFVLLSRNISDIYLKTALLRIPYAIVGLIGTIILSNILSKIIKNDTYRHFFILLFWIIEILSVPYTLHLREMRYYPLLIFFTVISLGIYLDYWVLRRINYHQYIFRIVPASLFLYFTYRPAFFIFIFFSCVNNILFILIKVIKNKNNINLNKQVFYALEIFLPVFIALLIVFPFLIFFKVFYFASQASQYFKQTIYTYFNHFKNNIDFYLSYDFLSLVIFLKIIILYIFFSKKNELQKYIIILQSSFILSLFFITYILLISGIPYYPFVRYHIVLQPILTLILLLDIFIIIQSFFSNGRNKPIMEMIIFSGIIVFLALPTLKKSGYLLNQHIHEISYQYKGPLDYIIPYIKTNFKEPEKLIIATNYEEYSYMYYLKSKVIIGYVGNNLEEDLKLQPDIIVFRNGWNTNPAIFNHFFSKTKYKEIQFPIVNYPLNNIPEFDFVFKHQFKTNYTEDPNKRLKIFVRDPA